MSVELGLPEGHGSFERQLGLTQVDASRMFPPMTMSERGYGYGPYTPRRGAGREAVRR